ncbi:hypothetical protein DUNSADRAFT_560 [Dunaliella salina]|uniref:Uncharacterized protein n=1 Tax=Dunaliella salina TaxID=3046 RepID=A0ABQ7FYR4_DUNSA|nr:hypothetical protein DUNSADRAFT_560 [Dunaliella salina]|eukprot:KAF5827495.1 hypothetical protein DUNSADRAFT_560 [Dunaliella salina]
MHHLLPWAHHARVGAVDRSAGALHPTVQPGASLYPGNGLFSPAFSGGDMQPMLHPYSGGPMMPPAGSSAGFGRPVFPPQPSSGAQSGMMLDAQGGVMATPPLGIRSHYPRSLGTWPMAVHDLSTLQRDVSPTPGPPGFSPSRHFQGVDPVHPPFGAGGASLSSELDELEQLRAYRAQTEAERAAQCAAAAPQRNPRQEEALHHARNMARAGQVAFEQQQQALAQQHAARRAMHDMEGVQMDGSTFAAAHPLNTEAVMVLLQSTAEEPMRQACTDILSGCPPPEAKMPAVSGGMLKQQLQAQLSEHLPLEL